MCRQLLLLPVPIPISAAAFQCEDSDGVPYPAGTKYYLRRTVESAVGSINAADVIFVVDESGEYKGAVGAHDLECTRFGIP